jgi:hypothetical protein
MNAPPQKERRPARSADHQNDNLNTQQLADQDLLGNIRRRLISGQSGADAYEVFTLHVHYEVQTADQKWTFTEKWEAILQQNRLSIEFAAKEGAHHDS